MLRPSSSVLRHLSSVLCLLFAAAAASLATTAAELPTPKSHFGFAIGDDYHLATYTQTEAYFKKLAAASDRLRLVDIGKTEEGRTQWMVVCTSPANLAKLDRYQDISRKLARAEGLSETAARTLAAEGRAVVWIDGGLHATETVGSHQLIETLWQFTSRTDAETLRILDQCIILFTHANPDGMELTSSWYMRRPEPAKRIVDALPRLYQKYIGHDNNRDFFMLNQRESTNIARQLYLEWIPQIVYNHHQTGPAGTVVAGPPYRDPFNYVYDPAVVTGLDSIGSAMNSRLNLENKPGYTQRTGSVFSTWWNGGLRTTTYFHNQLGLLTEITGSPTPMEIPLVPNRLVPSSANPFPATPQKWHYRQSIDYSVSLNYAVLDYAARQRDYLLFNIWRMGQNSIERGSRDHWTPYPKRIEAIKAAHLRDNPPVARAADADGEPSRFSSQNNRRIPSKYYAEVMAKPELRDPRGFILSADQPDFPTALKFLNALIKAGISVQRATADFTVAGKKYPAGSYVVSAAQAFRPHVIDMFEPQDHPNDFAYEGAAPTPPYDSAGWTLAFEMGVQFDRILDAFTGPFEKLPYGQLLTPPPVTVSSATAGWLLPRTTNNAYLLVNRLLAAGAPVSTVPATGEFFIPASAQAALAKAAADLGVTPRAAATAPADAKKITPARIALWDRYGGSMPSGWTRWLLEQFGYAHTVVYPPDLDAGKLREKFDVIIFPSGAVPRPNAPITDAGSESFTVREPSATDMPAEYRGRLGRFTPDKTVTALRAFLEAGGTVVTVGTSANLAYHLRLPIRNALTELDTAGRERPLPSAKYYIPGSILRVSLDPAAPATRGMPAEVDIYFDASPVFKLAPDAVNRGLRPLAWFPNAAPLRSGWAWGQHYLRDGVTAFEAPFANGGKLLVFGPEITFRAQTHGTFKLLFNALYQ